MNQTPAGSLEAIWIKRFRRGPMDPVSAAAARKGQGLENNANQGGKRQVTVISTEAMEKAQADLGRSFDPVARRANLMIAGLNLEHAAGRVLRVGELQIEVYGETRPCERMDAAVPGLRRALEPEWRGGVYGVVLNDATIRVGDPVEWAS
jgi:MOSC domain-containing protein YiiM